jgi:hypothetical protein
MLFGVISFSVLSGLCLNSYLKSDDVQEEKKDIWGALIYGVMSGLCAAVLLYAKGEPLCLIS